MKTYVVMISRAFPAYHPRKGENTDFVEQIFNEVINRKFYLEDIGEIFNHELDSSVEGLKLHTIRGNYELWKKRIEKVQSGEAQLSLRYWSGSPYNRKKDGSKQIQFLLLRKNDGVGIQKIKFSNNSVMFPRIEKEDGGKLAAMPKLLAKNDGLSLKDFKDWFQPYDLSEEMAIIHFTKFRY